jgi:hypothetical protein
MGTSKGFIDVTERRESAAEGVVILSSKGAEKLLMGPALEKPASAINRISNGRREGGWLGGELVGEGMAVGFDASSCFPQRPKREE